MQKIANEQPENRKPKIEYHLLDGRELYENARTNGVEPSLGRGYSRCISV